MTFCDFTINWVFEFAGIYLFHTQLLVYERILLVWGLIVSRRKTDFTTFNIRNYSCRPFFTRKLLLYHLVIVHALKWRNQCELGLQLLLRTAVREILTSGGQSNYFGFGNSKLYRQRRRVCKSGPNFSSENQLSKYRPLKGYDTCLMELGYQWIFMKLSHVIYRNLENIFCYH